MTFLLLSGIKGLKPEKLSTDFQDFFSFIKNDLSNMNEEYSNLLEYITTTYMNHFIAVIN